MNNCKKHTCGQSSYSPVPPGLVGNMDRAGMRICVFYEKMASGVKKGMGFRKFSYYCLTHLIGGDGFYEDGEQVSPLPLSPGDAVLVVPGHPHQYGGREKYFLEDSICFTGAAADALHQAGIIRNGVMNIGRERRLLPIIRKVQDPGMASQFEANIMLQQLLIDLFRERIAPVSEPGRHLEALLKEIHNSPGKWWTVAEMADYCNISTNHLRSLFGRLTGMPPKRYIERFKMNKAIEMLCSGELKISKIADCLGYADHYHFTRRFTACLGIAPARYRRMYSIRIPASQTSGNRREINFKGSVPHDADGA